MTPMALFLSGSVNPNAVEIAAGVALWATLLGWFGRPDPALDHGRALRATVAAVALVSARPLRSAVPRPDRCRRAPRGAEGRAPPGACAQSRSAAFAVAAVTIACVGWTLSVGTLQTSTVEYPEFENVRRYLYTMILSLDDFNRQMIGVLGLARHAAPVARLRRLVRDVRVPRRRGARRRRAASPHPLARARGSHGAHPDRRAAAGGAGARHSLAGALPPAARGRHSARRRLGALGEPRVERRRCGAGWATGLPLVVLAVLQVTAFWWALHRNVIGIDEGWIGFEPLWQPPLGWVTLTLAYAASVAIWTVVLATLVEPRVESIVRETERRLRSVDAAA